MRTSSRQGGRRAVSELGGNRLGSVDHRVRRVLVGLVPEEALLEVRDREREAPAGLALSGAAAFRPQLIEHARDHVLDQVTGHAQSVGRPVVGARRRSGATTGYGGSMASGFGRPRRPLGVRFLRPRLSGGRQESGENG